MFSCVFALFLLSILNTARAGMFGKDYRKNENYQFCGNLFIITT